MTSHNQRHQLEALLRQEHLILQKCVDLLTRQVPLTEWEHDVKVAFLLALAAKEGKEAYKAFAMARHLRIHTTFPTTDLPDFPRPFQRRCAERIRADLSKLVKLGAGRHLNRSM